MRNEVPTKTRRYFFWCAADLKPIEVLIPLPLPCATTGFMAQHLQPAGSWFEPPCQAGWRLCAVAAVPSGLFRNSAIKYCCQTYTSVYLLSMFASVFLDHVLERLGYLQWIRICPNSQCRLQIASGSVDILVPQAENCEVPQGGSGSLLMRMKKG